MWGLFGFTCGFCCLYLQSYFFTLSIAEPYQRRHYLFVHSYSVTWRAEILPRKKTFQGNVGVSSFILFQGQGGMALLRGEGII